MNKLKKFISLSLVLLIILIIITLFTSFGVSGQEEEKGLTTFNHSSICSFEKNDSAKGIDLVVETCTNVGVFSIGGLFNGSWQKLLYLYPKPWKGTFFSVNIDGKIYSDSLIPKDTISLDPYIISRPQLIGENEVVVKWQIPEENISIEEIFKLIENGTLIKIRVANNGLKNRNIGVRLHLDTMIGNNDGAPIYIPGEGLMTNEKDYTTVNFNYWKAYNREDTPTIVSTGVFSIGGKTLTVPDRFIISNWKKSVYSSWDYTTSPLVPIVGDSAIILYFSDNVLLKGENLEVTTQYGRAEPILPKEKEFGIADILLKGERKGYCQNDKIDLLVDVLSKGDDSGGRIKIEVENSSKEKIFSQEKKTGLVHEDEVRTISFNFSAPLNKESFPLFVTTFLIRKGEVIDKKVKAGFITFKGESNCYVPKEEGYLLNSFYAVLLFFLILLVIILVLYALRKRSNDEKIPPSFNENSILFKKIVTDIMSDEKEESPKERKISTKLVKIIVQNLSKIELKKCYIEDIIPEEVEIKVSTLGVRRSHSALIWETEKMKPSEKAIIEYTIKLHENIFHENIIRSAVFKCQVSQEEETFEKISELVSV